MKNSILLLTVLFSLSTLASYEATLFDSSGLMTELQVQETLNSLGAVQNEPLFSNEEKKIYIKNGLGKFSQTQKVTFKSEEDFERAKSKLLRDRSPLKLDALVLQIETQSAFSSNDPFSNLQWHLNNQGHTQNLDLDFMQIYKVQGVKDEDIFRSSSKPSVNQLGRKIRVAVLDTGIDKSHPDLKANIYRNELECQALAKFEKCVIENDRNTCEKKWMNLDNPEVDLDQNGYPLDCSGWSLLGGKNPAGLMGRPDFDDDQGHGTHVSGIIAAVRDNGIGISGVSDKVEILPIQVIGIAPNEPLKPLSFATTLNGSLPSPNEDQLKKPTQTLADLVARGVLYAIVSKVDIMNFSIGWPQTKDSDFMREIIKEAINQGILIVAAAGNDSTQALLRPCSYPDVICVGASNPDGSVAHYSNYGFGVDLLAPGSNILSTYPMKKRPVRFRRKAGYEYLHGTSQASPIVAGIAAELLAQNIPSSEVRARLIQTTSETKAPRPLLRGSQANLDQRVLKSPYQKFVFSGVANSITNNSNPLGALILPESKEEILLPWDPTQNNLTVSFVLKNIGASLSLDELDWQAQVVSRNGGNAPSISAIEGIPTHGQFSAQQRIGVKVSLVVPQEWMNSEIAIKLSYSQKGTSKQTLEIPIEIYVPVSPKLLNSMGLQTFQIQGLPLGRFSYLAIDDIESSVGREYLAVEYGEGKWSYTLLKQDEKNNYVANGSFSFLKPENADQVRETIVEKRDLNFDGVPEYILGIYTDNSDDDSETPAPSTLKIYVLNTKLKSLASYNIDSDRFQIPDRIEWMELNQRLTPTWMGYGKDPDRKIDLIDLWENPDQYEEMKNRLYYFSDLDSEKIEKISFPEGFELTDILNLEFQKGTLAALTAKNLGTEVNPAYLNQFSVFKVQNATVTFDRHISDPQNEDSYLNLIDTRVDHTQSLFNQINTKAGNFWFNEGIDKGQNIMWLTPDFHLHSRLIKAQRSEVDAALWVRSVSVGQNLSAAFVLTNSELQFHNLLTGETAAKSLERYTYFDSMMTTNFHFPTVISNKNGSDLTPALFLTESSELTRSLKVILPVVSEKNELGLATPAQFRLKTEKGCKPLETPVIDQSGITSFDFLCRNQILRYPLTK